METKRIWTQLLAAMTAKKASSRTKRAGIALLTAAAMLITPLGGMSGQFALDVRAADDDIYITTTDEAYVKVPAELVYALKVEADDVTDLDDDTEYEASIALATGGTNNNSLLSGDLDDYINLASDSDSIGFTLDEGGSATNGDLDATMTIEVTNAVPAGVFDLVLKLEDSGSDWEADFRVTVSKHVVQIRKDVATVPVEGNVAEDVWNETWEEDGITLPDLFEFVILGDTDEDPTNAGNSVFGNASTLLGLIEADARYTFAPYSTNVGTGVGVIDPGNKDIARVTNIGSTGNFVIYTSISADSDYFVKSPGGGFGYNVARPALNTAVSAVGGPIELDADVANIFPYDLSDLFVENAVAGAPFDALDSDPTYTVAAAVGNTLTGDIALTVSGTTLLFDGTKDLGSTGEFVVTVSYEPGAIYASGSVTKDITVTYTGSGGPDLEVNDLTDWLEDNLEVTYNPDDGDILPIGDSPESQVGYGPLQYVDDITPTADYDYGIPAVFTTDDNLNLRFRNDTAELIEAVKINNTELTSVEAFQTTGELSITGSDLTGGPAVVIEFTLDEDALLDSGDPAFTLIFTEVAQVIVQVDGNVAGADDTFASASGEKTPGVGEPGDPHYTYHYPGEDNYAFTYFNFSDESEENRGPRLAEYGTEVFGVDDELILVPEWNDFGKLTLNGDPVQLEPGSGGAKDAYLLEMEGPGLYVFDMLPDVPITIGRQDDEIIYGYPAGYPEASDPAQQITYEIIASDSSGIEADTWYVADTESPLPAGFSFVDGTGDGVGKQVHFEEVSDTLIGTMTLEYDGNIQLLLDAVTATTSFSSTLELVIDDGTGSGPENIAEADFDIVVDRAGGLYLDAEERNVVTVPVRSSMGTAEQIFNLNDILEDLAHPVIAKSTDPNYSTTNGYITGDVDFTPVSVFTDEDDVLGGNPVIRNNTELAYVGTGVYDADADPATLEVRLDSEFNYLPFVVTVEFVPVDDADIYISPQAGKLQYGLPGTAADPDADVPVPANPNGTVTFTITANEGSGIADDGGQGSNGVYPVSITDLPVGVTIVRAAGADTDTVTFAENGDGDLVATLELAYDGEEGIAITSVEDEFGFVRDLEITVDSTPTTVEGKIAIQIDRDGGLFLEAEDLDGAPENEIIIKVDSSETGPQTVNLLTEHGIRLDHPVLDAPFNTGAVSFFVTQANDPDGVLAEDAQGNAVFDVSEAGILTYTGAGSKAENTEATVEIYLGFTQNFEDLDVTIRFIPEDNTTPTTPTDMTALEEWLAFYTHAEYEDKDGEDHAASYGPVQDNVKLDRYEYGFPAVIDEDGTISVYFLDYEGGESSKMENGAAFIVDVAGAEGEKVGRWNDEPGEIVVDGIPVGGILTVDEDDLKEGPIVVKLVTTAETADGDAETFELTFSAMAQVAVLVNNTQEGVLRDGNIVNGTGEVVENRLVWTTAGGDNYNFVYIDMNNTYTSVPAGKTSPLALTGADNFKKDDTLNLTPEIAYFQGLTLNGVDVSALDEAGVPIDENWKPNANSEGYGTYEFTVPGPGYYEFNISSLNPGVTVNAVGRHSFTYGELAQVATYTVRVTDIDPGEYEITEIGGLDEVTEYVGVTDVVDETRSVVLSADHDGEEGDSKKYVTIGTDRTGSLKLDIGEQAKAENYPLTLKLAVAGVAVDRSSADFDLEIKKRPLTMNVDAHYVAALESGKGAVELVYPELIDDQLDNIFFRLVEADEGQEPLYDQVRLEGNVPNDDGYALPETAEIRDPENYWEYPNVFIDMEKVPGYKTKYPNATEFEYKLTGADSHNYSLTDPNLHVDAGVVIESILVSPDRAILRGVDDTAIFTVSSNLAHFDASLVEWGFLGNPDDLPVSIVAPARGATVTVKQDRPLAGTDDLTVELVAIYPGTDWVSTATIQLIPEVEDLEVTLLDSSVTVNRAKVVGGILPVRISGAQVDGDGGGSIGGFGTMSADGVNDSVFTDVRLVTGSSPLTNEVPGYTAWMNDDLNVVIATTEQNSQTTVSRNVNGVTVFLLPMINSYTPGEPGKWESDPEGTYWGDLSSHWIQAAGSVNLRATTVYPRITIAQPSLDRFFNATKAQISPTERSGDTVRVVEAVSRHTDRVSAEAIDGVGYVNLVANPAKGGSATVRLTLAVDGYKEQMLRKWNKGMASGNQFDRSVKLSTAKPSINLSPNNPTLKHQGNVGRDVEIAIQARNAWTTNQLGRVEKVEIYYNNAKAFGSKHNTIVEDGELYRDWQDGNGGDFVYSEGNRLWIPIPGALGQEPGVYQVRIYFDGGAEVINQKLTIRNTGSPKLTAAQTRITLNAHSNTLGQGDLPERAVIEMRTNPLNLIDRNATAAAYEVEYKDGKAWKELNSENLDFIGSVDVWNDLESIAITLDHTKTANLTARTLQLRISETQSEGDTGQRAAAPDTRVRLTITPAKPTVQIKSSGRISVINPDSFTRLNLTLANTNDWVEEFQIGSFVGGSFVADPDFRVVQDTPTSYRVFMRDKTPDPTATAPNRLGYGHGYITPGTYDLAWQATMSNGQILNSVDNARNAASGRVRLQPNQAAARLARSKNAVTLYNQNPYVTDSINIRFTQGAQGYDLLTFQGGSWDNDSETYIRTAPNFGTNGGVQTGLSLTRTGANDWVFRMLNRVSLTDAGNRALTKPITVKNARLDAWPLGSYRLKNDGTPDLDDATKMPQPYTNPANGKALTRPTTITVNVNVRP